MQMANNYMEKVANLPVEYYKNIQEYLFLYVYIPVTNLPPLEIVPPVITNAWLCYFPTTDKFEALTI